MRSRHRLLMISPAAPWPATTGGLVRIDNLLRQLARHFDVTFVSPRHAGQPVPDIPARFECPPIGAPGGVRRMIATLDPGRPVHAARYFRAEIARIVRRELSEHRYDAVYSHFIYGMEYLRRCPVPVVIDQQNVDRVYWCNKAEHSRFPARVLARWNTHRTIRYETRALPDIWAYVSVSEEDREQTRAYAGGISQHFWVAANGVDPDRFTPASAPPEKRIVTLGYLGSMDLEMNIEAVQRFCAVLLPRIRARLRGVDLEFVVIGRAPTTALQKVAARTPGMSLSGTVDDVVPWLQRVTILVSPLRIGAGTKLKVAEALSCALPVVGTSLAFAGLSGSSGVHYVTADTDDAFVDAVCSLAVDEELRRRIGAAARSFARAELAWDAIGDRLAADLRDALAERGRDGGSREEPRA